MKNYCKWALIFRHIRWQDICKRWDLLIIRYINSILWAKSVAHLANINVICSVRFLKRATELHILFLKFFFSGAENIRWFSTIFLVFPIKFWHFIANFFYQKEPKISVRKPHSGDIEGKPCAMLIYNPWLPIILIIVIVFRFLSVCLPVYLSLFLSLSLSLFIYIYIL